MSVETKNLANEALNEVCTSSVSPDSFASSVETWTLDKEKNPRLVDSLGYIPREKIIARGIANGELLNAFRRTPEFMQQFDSSIDESFPAYPDVNSLDEMEIADLAKSNASVINSKLQSLKSKTSVPEEPKVKENTTENKTE